MLSSTTSVRSTAVPLALPLQPVDPAEHESARFWRRCKAQLTVAELARITGYSMHAIRQFEKPRGDRVQDPKAWRRYKCCCGYVDDMRFGGASFYW